MPPNLELFLVAFLHGSLIASILLLTVFAATAALLLTFALGLLSITALDLLEFYPLLSWCYEATKANLKLGSILIACVIVDRAVGVALLLKPSLESVVCEFKGIAKRLRGYIDALKLN